MSLVGSYGTQHPLHMSHHHILMGTGAHDPQYPSYYTPGTHYPPQVEASFLSPSPASSAASSPPSTDDPSAFYSSGAWCTPYCDTPSAPSASPEGGYQDYTTSQHHLGTTFPQHPPLQNYRPQQQQPPQSGEATPQPFVRVVKRRNTANKKERRRTQSINTAFADLRDCIPNVPSDTKLSKIKTLRLATSYIAYLMGVLASEDPASDVGFKADIMQGKKVPGVGAVSDEGSSETAEQGALTDVARMAHIPPSRGDEFVVLVGFSFPKCSGLVGGSRVGVSPDIAGIKLLTLRKEGQRTNWMASARMGTRVEAVVMPHMSLPNRRSARYQDSSRERGSAEDLSHHRPTVRCLKR
ncbi:hypothetical protein J437_LFUL002274 [Ladona fulva]|uniref:BHLH domain-containing protein n=1 Tax=Ladona fulva TaxID=123851 RepID=A0A8K0NX12_LADFU|nr:hypothetical protein J437_LFUL002274 [Ladona fulva]